MNNAEYFEERFKLLAHLLGECAAVARELDNCIPPTITHGVRLNTYVEVTQSTIENAASAYAAARAFFAELGPEE